MPALELWHNNISTCSQKVRLALAEKELVFESHEINLVAGEQHAAEYVKLNKNHVVPTLAHDGHVFIESSLINEYLEEAFPEVPLAPETPTQRHAMRLWTKQIDEKVHPAASVLTFAIGARPMQLSLPREKRDAAIAAIPDPVRRAARRSVLDHGIEAPEFAGALRSFLDLFDGMESALASSPWLTGEDFGLADAAALPYVLRVEHLAMTPVISSPSRPRVADWFARVKARPSYRTAVDAWTPHDLVEMMRSNGEAVWPDVEPLAHRS